VFLPHILGDQHSEIATEHLALRITEDLCRPGVHERDRPFLINSDDRVRGAHYSYYSTNPQWHLYGKPEYPSHEAIIAARDNIMKKHPTLVVVGAHLGSLEHDLEGIAARLEKYPNFNIEVAARTRNLTRHPSDKVRALFLKYPTRIMYGVDSTWAPYSRNAAPTDMQRQGHVNRLTLQYKADYDYYAGSGEMTYNNRKTTALNLPRSVLEKFYHENAERIYRLPEAWRRKQ
jgi:predicted TIM-barrel fold metal-dependent hydrolase